MTFATAKKHSKPLSNLLAKVEQLVFDKQGVPIAATGPLQEAKLLLTQLHAGQTAESQLNFQAYLTNLDALVETGKTGEYGNSLLALMRAVGETDNPSETLLSIVEAESVRRSRDGFVGTEENVLPPQFFGEFKEAELGDVPASHMLGAREYQSIKMYFEGEKNYVELSDRAQGLVESMRYSPEDYSRIFPNRNEAAKIHELRTQLEMELRYDDVISTGELALFREMEVPFEVTLPTYNPVVAAHGHAMLKNPGLLPTELAMSFVRYDC